MSQSGSNDAGRQPAAGVNGILAPRVRRSGREPTRTSFLPVTRRLVRSLQALLLLFGVLALSGCFARVEYVPEVAEDPVAEDEQPPPDDPSPEPTATPEPTPTPTPTRVPQLNPDPADLPTTGGYAVSYGVPLAFSDDGSAILVEGLGSSGLDSCDGQPNKSIWRVPLDGTPPTEEVTGVFPIGVTSFAIADGWAMWIEACSAHAGSYRTAVLAADGHMTNAKRISIDGGPSYAIDAFVQPEPDGSIRVVGTRRTVSFQDGELVGPIDAASTVAERSRAFAGKPRTAYDGSSFYLDEGLIMVVPGAPDTGMTADLVSRSLVSPDGLFRAIAALPDYSGVVGAYRVDGDCDRLAVQRFDGRGGDLFPESANGFRQITSNPSGGIIVHSCDGSPYSQMLLTSWDEIKANVAPLPVGPPIEGGGTGIVLDAVTESGASLSHQWSGAEWQMEFDGSAAVGPGSGAGLALRVANRQWAFSIAVVPGWTAVPSGGDGFELRHERSPATISVFGTTDEVWTRRTAESIEALGGDPNNIDVWEAEDYRTMRTDAKWTRAEVLRLDYVRGEVDYREKIVFAEDGRAVVIAVSVPQTFVAAWEDVLEMFDSLVIRATVPGADADSE